MNGARHIGTETLLRYEKPDIRLIFYLRELLTWNAWSKALMAILRVVKMS